MSLTNSPAELPLAGQIGAPSFVPLGEIADVKLGKMLDRSKHKSGRNLPYLRNVNVRWGYVDTTDVSEMFFKNEDEEERYSVRKGDVLVCEGGEPGRAAVWTLEESDLKFQKALHRVRFRDPYEPKLLVFFLEWAAGIGELEKRFTGSTIKHFTKQAFVKLPVPNPTLPEQRRIVARIEELFSHLDAGVAALRQAKAQLQRYRQSVLTAAVTGRLTQAWRKQHPDTEPAEDLHKRILEQRREQWNGKGKYKEPADPKELAFELPSTSWVAVSIDQLTVDTTIGLVRSAAIQNLTGDGYAYLKMDKVDMKGGVNLGGLVYVDASQAEVERFSLHQGDVLFNTRNSVELVGKTGHVASEPASPVVFNNNLMRLRFVEEILPAFVATQMCSKPFRGIMEGAKRATTSVAAVYGKDLRPLPIALPPLAEQHQIVAEVEARTTAITHLEAELDRQITRSNRLRQSILAAAFSAKLCFAAQ